MQPSHSPYMLFVSSLLGGGREAFRSVLQAGIDAGHLLDDRAAQVFQYLSDYYRQHKGWITSEVIYADTQIYVPAAPSEPLSFWQEKVVELRQHASLLELQGLYNKLLQEGRTEDAMRILEEGLRSTRRLSPAAGRTKSRSQLMRKVAQRHRLIKSGFRGVPYPWPKYTEATLGLWPMDVAAVLARPGGMKCVDAQTEIFDPKTGLVRTIEAVFNSPEHTHVLSWSQDGGMQTQPIAAKVDTGEKHCLRFHLESGRTIVVTPEHPFLTPKHWVRAENIEVGETFAIAAKYPEPEEPVEMQPTEIHFMALEVGGSFLDEVPENVYRLSRAQLQQFFECLWQVRGLSGAPGDRLWMTSPRVTSQLQHLLLRIGHKSISRRDPSKGSPFWELVLGTPIPEEHEIYWDSVVSIEDAGVRKIYDLSVEPTRCFVANDIVVHNTWLLVLWALKAHQAGKRVLFATTEMSEEEIGARLWSLDTKIPFHRLWTGHLSPSEERLLMQYEEVADLGSDIGGVPFDIVSEEFDMDLSTLEYAARDTDPDFILVDGAYLMKPEDRKRMKRNERHAEAFEGLKRVNRRIKAAMAISSQLNRDYEKDKSKNAKEGDKPESGLRHASFSEALGQVASWMYYIEELEDSDLRLLVPRKTRHLKLDPLTFKADFENMDFSEADDIEEEDEAEFEIYEKGRKLGF